MESQANGDNEILIEMNKMKLYLRQDVFIKQSKFLTRGLERMMPKAPEEKPSEKVLSTATSKMVVKMSETLVLLECPESKNCVCMDLTLNILMKSVDPENLKLFMKPRDTKLWSLMRIDVSHLCILLCKTDDLEDNGYELAEKRDVL